MLLVLPYAVVFGRSGYRNACSVPQFIGAWKRLSNPQVLELSSRVNPADYIYLPVKPRGVRRSNARAITGDASVLVRIRSIHSGRKLGCQRPQFGPASRRIVASNI